VTVTVTKLATVTELQAVSLIKFEANTRYTACLPGTQHVTVYLLHARTQPSPGGEKRLVSDHSSGKNYLKTCNSGGVPGALGLRLGLRSSTSWWRQTGQTFPRHSCAQTCCDRTGLRHSWFYWHCLSFMLGAKRQIRQTQILKKLKMKPLVSHEYRRFEHFLHTGTTWKHCYPWKIISFRQALASLSFYAKR
jgi:hypothetical protein